MKSIISMKDISKRYGNTESKVSALNKINLDISEGEFISITGKSGSGKSTLMNIMGCLDIPTEGVYLLNGIDVRKLSDKKISEIRNQFIGFIFQGFNLIPSLTAIENVELPLIYRKIPKKVRKDLSIKSLIKVGLEHRIFHKPSEMSGGQQQRVAIARAIAASPNIILADEPTGNLDSNSGNEVLKILHDLNKSGKTVIIITHDQKIANTANRKIIVSDGNIIEDNLETIA